MKYLKYLLMVSLAAFLFVSCSDDDDDNPTNNGNNNSNKVYFNAKTDDWWIYYNAEIDENENEIEPIYYDTTKYIRPEKYTDAAGITKNTAVYETKTNLSDDIETSYFVEDLDAIWTTTDFILPEDLQDFDLPINLVAGYWIKIINKEEDDWTIFEEITIEDVELDFEFTKITTDITYEVTGKFESEVSKEYMGAQWDADHFIITTKIGTDIGIELEIPAHIYMIQNFGIAEIYIPPFSLNYSIFSETFNGSHRIIVDTRKIKFGA